MKKLLTIVCVLIGQLVYAKDVDPNLKQYSKVSGISGTLTSVGSDTLNNLMAFWAEEFKRIYPNVSIQVQGMGSSTAPPALTEGTANLGPMSRPMKDVEIKMFEQKYGYKPTAIGVAIDTLAIFVHKDNPIKGLTIPQIDTIFSATSLCGYHENITTWKQLSFNTAITQPIQLYGRNAASGTYGYFKEHGLCKGDFKDTVNEQPGSASVIQSIANSINGIGYSGIGYQTSGVRAVPLSKGDGQELVIPNNETAISGKYPLSRLLFIYVNKHPNKRLPPLEREFIKMVLSKTGQTLVVKDGYIPLPVFIVNEQLKKASQDGEQ